MWRTCYVAHQVFDKLRVVVGRFGHVFLVGAFQQAEYLARGTSLGNAESTPRSPPPGELHLTKPAVSVQVKELEGSGLPPFEQLGRKVYLTRAGPST